MDKLTVAKTACSHLSTRMSERTLSDYQPLFDSLADDVVLIETTSAESTRVDGKQALIDAITGTFTTLSDPEKSEDVELECPLEFLSNDGDHVVVLWTECTRDKTTGITGNSTEVVVMMDFRDGLIARMRKFVQ